MSMYYSDPRGEEDDFMLPDVEVFYLSKKDFQDAEEGTWMFEAKENQLLSQLVGWYYQNCLPGCLPNSEPIGPFATEMEALEAAREE